MSNQNSHTALVGMQKLYSHFGKTVYQFLTEFNTDFPYNPAIPQTKTYLLTKICIQMLTAALFTKAKN